jgi:hypothetical protein
MEIIIVVVSWIVFGGITSYFASQRGRDPFGWFLIGLLLGVLGLLVLFLLPPIKAEEEQEAEGEKAEGEIVPAPPVHYAHDWFYLDSGRQRLGPCSFLTLRRDWHLQKLCQDTYVWTEGMENWQRIKELPELKQALES